MAVAPGSRATLARKLVPRSSIAATFAQLLRGVERRGDDRHVAGTAAQMSAEELAHLRFGRRWFVAQITVERHQDAGSAEPALQRVAAPERILQHREAAGLRREAFDSAQYRAVCLHREHQASAARR